MSVSGLDHVVATAAAAADEVDRSARFPREAVDAMRAHGLLGLTVPEDLGGLGGGPVEMVEAVTAIASACPSSAMVFTMHLTAMRVLASAGSERADGVLRAAAAGRHLATLALSERATRSNFWYSVQPAENVDGGVALRVDKSFVTSAGPADSYVVSAAAPGRATLEEMDLYLVTPGDGNVEIVEWWQGAGLRGNGSSPVRFDVVVPPDARLNEPGRGQATVFDVVLPWFQLGAAATSLGIARCATEVASRHVAETYLEHLSQRLADQPVVRHGLGRLRVQADALAGFLRSAAEEMAAGTASMERVLQLKVAANEVALQVTDEGMRLCGGVAYSGHHPLDRLFRDARAGVVMAPTADMLYDMIGRVATGMPLISPVAPVGASSP